MPIKRPQVGGHASFGANYTASVDDDCRLPKRLATTFSEPSSRWPSFWHADNSDVHRDAFESQKKGGGRLVAREPDVKEGSGPRSGRVKIYDQE